MKTSPRQLHTAPTALDARIRQQALVAELGLRALDGADPYALIDEAVEQIAAMLDLEFCRVLELMPGEDVLRACRPGGTGTRPVYDDERVPVDSITQAGYTVLSNEPVVVHDHTAETRFRTPAFIAERGMLSGITVAMRSQNRAYGVLAAHSRTPRSFTADDVDFLQAAANVLAAALQRQRTEAALRDSQERLRQSERLEAVGLLAGGIAHDFNNLLTAVVGFSELLMMDLDADDPRFMYAEEIKRAGERASNLTSQLLAFSRRQVLQPRVLDLNEVVGGMEQLMRRAITDRVDLVLALAPGLGRVKADDSQLGQVLLNLAVNARDAMPQRGTLTIQTANVEADARLAQQWNLERGGVYVMLSVTDTGTGIDDATKARLFEPFFTTKEPGKGTGLGLATVYGIVKQTGGEIEVCSELGRGTAFNIYLPAVEKGEEVAPAVTPVPVQPRGRETILLAEDEDGVRALARTVLQSSGYVVLEARRGDEALQIFEQHPDPIDLLVTDLVMPGMGGRELAERIAAHGRPTKVLYMSGYSNDRMLELSWPYLQKPITPSTLAQKVREVLEAPRREVPGDRA